MSTEPQEIGNGGAPSELDARLERLVAASGGLESGPEQRRENLVERAESRGVGRPEAEQAYDLSAEVGLEPALGMAVVMEGISVRLLDGPPTDADASEASEPEWVDTPPGTAEAERERRLRQTFRRLRSLVEDAPSAAAAVGAFAREPDLEPYDY